MKYVIIDVEASGFDGFPIEVGWCDQHGASESHLVYPAWDWTSWDIEAERLHGISREILAAEGEPYEVVAELVAAMLTRCRRELVVVASDNPVWDCEWLVTLLRRAGIRDVVHLADVMALFAAAVKPLFENLAEDGDPESEPAYQAAQTHAVAIIRAAKAQVTARPKHRAAADARRLRDVIEIIKAEVVKATIADGIHETSPDGA